MAEITASIVMKLRKISGQGMMDCKKALAETDGDMDQALEQLRKKGLATMEKRAGRDTSEGRVVCNKSDDGKTVAMAMLCCETDFSSKSDDFIALANTIAGTAMTCDATEGADALGAVEVDGKPLTQLVTELISKTGEKTEIGEFNRYSVEGTGAIGSYVHFNNKTGAMLEIETSSDEVSAAVANVAVDIAMHITAIKPAGLDRESMDPAIVEKKKAEFTEQVQGKPAEIIGKIVEGKMNKFFGEDCLVDQGFVKDDSMTVGEALTNAAKKAGGEAKIKRFIRFEIE